MNLSVDKFTKVETYKGVKKKSDGLADFFVDLKFNTKKPKYNYHSGLVAGMMVNYLTILEPLVKGKSDKKIINDIVERLIPMATTLVETYNWKLFDLTNLAHQFFGEEDE